VAQAFRRKFRPVFLNNVEADRYADDAGNDGEARPVPGQAGDERGHQQDGDQRLDQPPPDLCGNLKPGPVRDGIGAGLGEAPFSLLGCQPPWAAAEAREHGIPEDRPEPFRSSLRRVDHGGSRAAKDGARGTV
jgi:hypothetical protein